MLFVIIHEVQQDPMRAALALTWGFLAFGAVLSVVAISRRNARITSLESQLANVRFEGAKTQILPDWLVSRRSTVVGDRAAILPRFRLPAERLSQR